MKKVTVDVERVEQILERISSLQKDIESLLDQDEITKKRLRDLEEDSSLATPESELRTYLKKRGVKNEG